MDVRGRVSTLVLWACIAGIGHAATSPANQEQFPTTAELDSLPLEERGGEYFNYINVAELDTLAESLLAANARDQDGRFQLHVMTMGLVDFLERAESQAPSTALARLGIWKKERPESTFRLVVEAMNLRAVAWNARGNRFAGSVVDEGWRIFERKNQEAWRVLMDSRARASRYPTWYETAIGVAIDSRHSPAEIRALFDEGIAKFPGFDGLYYSYMRGLHPRWGGSYAALDKFILEMVAAKTNREGEMLYTRLYWHMGGNDWASTDFIDRSLVDWTRMRAGFEAIYKKYPRGKVIRPAFASFACQAKDAATYSHLRARLDAELFRDVSPDGYSLAVCDERFFHKPWIGQ